MSNIKILLVITCIIIIYTCLLFKNKKISTQNNNKKISFLFLIYDEINHEELWYNFFKDIDTSKYSIYIHYKDNKPLKYFEKYKLDYCVPTEWGGLFISRST